MRLLYCCESLCLSWAAEVETFCHRQATRVCVCDIFVSFFFSAGLSLFRTGFLLDGLM